MRSSCCGAVFQHTLLENFLALKEYIYDNEDETKVLNKNTKPRKRSIGFEEENKAARVAQSPDLNLIENQQKELKIRVHRRDLNLHFKRRDIEEIDRVWEVLP